jgi:carbonic anhydrase
MMVVFVGLAVAAAPARARAQWRTHWTYDGPAGSAHWGDLDPEYAACKEGRAQSPVDIRDVEKADLPAIRFEYGSGPLRYLINNGYTIRVNYHDAPGTGNFLVMGGRRYQLTQFHFHRPSEELIDGKVYPMVVHLMHRAGDGAILGVAVLVRLGRANATVQRIWDHMLAAAGKEETIPGVEVDPSGLLPADHSYYIYPGSLTAPPCTEGVTWLVLKTPVDIAAEQVAAFARLYPHDVRPIQPLNGRVVKESR